MYNKNMSYYLAVSCLLLLACSGVLSCESALQQIGVVNFDVGNGIKVKYITPNHGRPTFDLRDDSTGNIVLHVNPRWDTHEFILNSYINGQWGQEEKPTGFDFTSGVPIKIRVEAKSDYFNIVVNDQVLHQYNYRLPVTSVTNVWWCYDPMGAGSIDPQLDSIKVYFPH